MDIDQLPRIETREFLGGCVQAVDDQGRTATIRFQPPAGTTNPHGSLQGGFAAAMIDDVVSLATWLAGGERAFVTSSLNCHYLRPVPSGQPLLVSCQLIRAGRRQAVFDAEVRVEGDDDLLARAVQTQQFL